MWVCVLEHIVTRTSHLCMICPALFWLSSCWWNAKHLIFICILKCVLKSHFCILRNLIENLVLQSGSISRDSLIDAYVKASENTRIPSLLAHTFKMDVAKLTWSQVFPSNNYCYHTLNAGNSGNKGICWNGEW